MKNDDANTKKRAVSLNPETTPILYTDNIHVSVNEFGVVLDITQRIGNDIRIVSRVGMSREQAKKFAKELAKLLAVTENTTSNLKKN